MPLLLVLLLSCWDTALGGTVEGVIFSDHGPVAESQVFAYPDYQSLVSKEAYVKSSPGEKDGQYKLELPPGNYYLTATGELSGQRLFSYHGINPITVADDYRWLPFFLSEEQEPVCINGEGQGLSGLVSYQGAALDHGVISVYKSQDGKFRGMGLFTNTIGADGRFRFNLEPGSYVVVARQKKAEAGIGPVLQGDLFCYPATNPVIIADEQLCELAIECYPRDNLEAYLTEDAVNPQGRRHESRRQASLWNIQPEAAQTAIVGKPTTITGRVTNLNGQPVADLVVTAYPAMGIDIFQMHILRLITENRARTDQQGQYRIQLPGGGLYYLQARQKIGEAPDRLEYYGLYEGNQNHAIRINPGENRSNINIPVSRIMPFSDLKERLTN
ncbi:MAG: carboxypeptidase regulatory-like domain-containing protein [Desulfobulbaceae bacterium]|nr:carboxypeptidase regulatory-like domain-containing protein [Desulfobulbaceae bacterium]